MTLKYMLSQIFEGTESMTITITGTSVANSMTLTPPMTGTGAVTTTITDNEGKQRWTKNI